MGSTSIEWTDVSVNPIRARRKGSTATKGGYSSGVGHYCEKVSPGCRNCYSSALQPRFGLPLFQEQRVGTMGETEVFFDASKLEEVLRIRKPARVFWCDMTDMFGRWVPNEWIAACFGVMAATPHLTHQVLTRRAARLPEWFGIDGIANTVDRFKHIALAGRIQEYFAPEREAPIDGFPSYRVTSKGRILTLGGGPDCLLCGKPNGNGSPKKKFCGPACRSKASYEQKMGRWTEPAATWRPMSPDTGEFGHSRVMLYREDGSTEKALVHRLVLSAFDRLPREGEQGAHGDGDATNNALWNLRWDSQEGNFADRHRHGTRRTHHRLSLDDVAEIRRRASLGETAAALGTAFGVSDTQVRNITAGKQWAPEYEPEWPLKSVHLGVSVENQATADERIPDLRKTPAAVRWVSAEPLLGGTRILSYDAEDGEYGPGWNLTAVQNRTDYGTGIEHDVDAQVGIDWCVVGGESGPGARPFDIAWGESLVAEFQAADVPVFVKQLGRVPMMAEARWRALAASPLLSAQNQGRAPEGFVPLKLSDPKGGNPDEWPEALRVREFPRVEASHG